MANDLEEDLIFDWNTDERANASAVDHVALHDETLRDGIQDPSVVDPSVEDKIGIVEAMARVGIESVDLGIPSAGRRAFAHTVRLAEHIAAERLPIGGAAAERPNLLEREQLGEQAQMAACLHTAPDECGNP